MNNAEVTVVYIVGLIVGSGLTLLDLFILGCIG